MIFEFLLKSNAKVDSALVALYRRDRLSMRSGLVFLLYIVIFVG